MTQEVNSELSTPAENGGNSKKPPVYGGKTERSGELKIFVQSSTLPYADRFSRKFDILSQIYFVPSIQSFFHFHLAYSLLHFHVANKFLVAHSEPPALPIGSRSKQEER